MSLRKLIHTVVIVAIAGVAISGVVDDVSQTYAEQALKRALATFAVARTLNGVISVAQGTELALEPGGVGVVLAPGQVLDPVNDLVERFSSVMVVAASSLGLQLILLEIFSWWTLTAILVASLAVWLAAAWSPDLRRNKYVGLMLRLTLVFAVIRFAVPVAIISTNFFFDAFLLSKHDLAASELDTSARRIEEIHSQMSDITRSTDQSSSAEPAESSSGGDSFEMPDLLALATDLKSSARKLYSDFSNWLNSLSISMMFEQLKESAAQATNHIIDLIVIFVLQTIIFPLAFLWVFVELLKAVASRTLSRVSERPGWSEAAKSS